MATKGIWIPIEVLQDHNLTMQEKFVLVEIYQLIELDTNQCYASNEHFATLLNISKKSVSNVVSSLVKKGKITVELSDRNHKRLLSIKDGHLSTKDGHPSIKDGQSKDNNSINNSINKKTSKKKQKNMHADNNFLRLISELGMRCSHRSKVRKTKEAYDAYMNLVFDGITNDELIAGYVDHQNEKQSYALSLQNYLMDYKAIIKESEPDMSDTEKRELRLALAMAAM